MRGARVVKRLGPPVTAARLMGWKRESAEISADAETAQFQTLHPGLPLAVGLTTLLPGLPGNGNSLPKVQDVNVDSTARHAVRIVCGSAGLFHLTGLQPAKITF